MQVPIERRHGAPVAILISSLFFLTLHLTKAWATPYMVPIVFGAGVVLGLLAWSSGSLIPGMIGHVVMDTGLFAYWWTGIAGDFTARPITETGVDRPFVIACVVFASFGEISLESRRPSSPQSRGRMTAAAVTGPNQVPRPTSSKPAIKVAPDSYAWFSCSKLQTSLRRRVPTRLFVSLGVSTLPRSF
jgi:hypothetical protein